jgi:hypothetical protein
LAFAQAVISARSGLINYVEGDVTLAGAPVVVTTTDFPQMKDGQDLVTESGRAEVLLTPGVFLRLAENSHVRMVSDSLEDTRLELVTGSAILEVGEMAKDQNLTVRVKGRTLEFPKRGLFRLDAGDVPTLRVFDGQAIVASGEEALTVKEGRIAELAAVPAVEKFDKRLTDAFHRWASRRASYIAMANVWAAKSIYERNVGWRASDWLYNPYFGSFTYLPYRRYASPFGWSYYSPHDIQSFYYRPAPMYNPGSSIDAGMRGWGSMGSGGGRSSSMGTVSAGGGMSAPAPAPSGAPVSSGGRGGDGGGRSGGGGR